MNIPEAAVEAAAFALFEKELGRPMEASDEPLYSEDIQACREDARAALQAAAPHMLAEAWDEAIQLADDEGCLLYHQAKGLKSLNPYRAAQRNEEA